MTTPVLTPQQFLANWQGTTLSERSSYQAHFSEVCQLVGYETPTGTGEDHEGNTFMFEYSLKKQSGGQGYADVYLENHFAVEYKAPDKYKDLRAAYDQLLQYREQLKNPPLLVVTDIANWEIHTNWSNTETKIYKFTHQEIAERPSILETVRHLFHDPAKLHPNRNTEQVTQDAAEVFRIIADNMRDWEAEPDRIARFLTKLVFCLFAEDVSLLPSGPKGEAGIFSEIIEQTRHNSERFVQYTHDLFNAMAEGGDVLFQDIPYFNGSLFEDVQVEELKIEALTELARASRLNWEAIEPAIFGTLFERSLDPNKRAQLGAHYTSRDDILLIVEPVLMRPLEREWEQIQLEAQPFREKLDNAKTKKAQTTNSNKLADLRERMLARLREITVLDPACGSGNFLYVALQRLMDMEKAVITDPLFEGLQRPLPEVHPKQMYGIEKDPIAHALASIVVWIGWLQWKRTNGYPSYPEPILQDLSENIVCKDAILSYLPPSNSPRRHGEDALPPSSSPRTQGEDTLPPSSSPRTQGEDTLPPSSSPRTQGEDTLPPSNSPRTQGEDTLPPSSSPRTQGEDTLPPSNSPRTQGEDSVPTEPEWPEVDVIVGNPPFLGDKKMRGELGDQYTEDLRGLYEGRISGQADLVTYWFEKASGQIEHEKVKRVGLLSTNSIRGGANREVLDHIKEVGDIFMAWSDREWTLEGASVRVSIIGCDGGTEKEKLLDNIPVDTINSDLTANVDVTQAERVIANSNISFVGTQKTGPFDIDEELAQKILSSNNKSNIHNSDVVKRLYNAKDLTQKSRNMWVIDFGVDPPIEQAKQYQMPFEYVEKTVFPVRQTNRQKWLREKWWVHEKSRPAMREALNGLNRYIATPLVSKHRVFVWLDAQILATNLLIVVARDDDYFFGVLHSKLHEVWSLRMGTSLGKGNDPRYTPTTTFETFPFPWSPDQEDESSPLYGAIGQAARVLHQEREAWLQPPSNSPRRQGEDILPTSSSPRTQAEDVPSLSTKRARVESHKDRTLTNLYNALVAYRAMVEMGKVRDKPKNIKAAAWDFAPRLAELHDALDEAVCAAYGWDSAILGDEEAMLRNLLALNLERAETPL